MGRLKAVPKRADAAICNPIHAGSLPRVNDQRKPYQGKGDNSLFTEEAEPRLRWLGLMLYLSADINRHLHEFEQVLSLPL